MLRGRSYSRLRVFAISGAAVFLFFMLFFFTTLPFHVLGLIPVVHMESVRGNLFNGFSADKFRIIYGGNQLKIKKLKMDYFFFKNFQLPFISFNNLSAESVDLQLDRHPFLYIKKNWLLGFALPELKIDSLAIETLLLKFPGMEKPMIIKEILGRGVWLKYPPEILGVGARGDDLDFNFRALGSQKNSGTKRSADHDVSGKIKLSFIATAERPLDFQGELRGSDVKANLKIDGPEKNFRFEAVLSEEPEKRKFVLVLNNFGLRNYFKTNYPINSVTAVFKGQYSSELSQWIVNIESGHLDIGRGRFSLKPSNFIPGDHAMINPFIAEMKTSKKSFTLKFFPYEHEGRLRLGIDAGVSLTGKERQFFCWLYFGEKCDLMSEAKKQRISQFMEYVKRANP